MAAENEFARRSFLKRAALGAGAIGVTGDLFAGPPAAKAATRTTGGGHTVRLAQYAAALRYEELPAPVVRRIKDCITDTVAAILYGEKLPWSRIIIAHAQRTGAGRQKPHPGHRQSPVQAPRRRSRMARWRMLSNSTI